MGLVKAKLWVMAVTGLPTAPSTITGIAIDIRASNQIRRTKIGRTAKPAKAGASKAASKANGTVTAKLPIMIRTTNISSTPNRLNTDLNPAAIA